MEYYWELEQFDGTTSRIPPDAVDVIKRRWQEGQPINLTGMSIPANQIKKFAITDQPFTDQLLLEDVAQAFGEPIIASVETPYGYMDEAIQCRWVKKSVTNDKWNRYYSDNPAYKFLEETGGMTVVAFIMPSHLKGSVDNCSPDEIKILTTN